MPPRKPPLINNFFYHIFNRGIHKKPIFTTKREYKRALTTAHFYKFNQPTTKLSIYLTYSKKRKVKFFKNIQNDKLIDILAYCFMPNHFHLLLKQKQKGGISKFLADFQNSYARYFNNKNNKSGPVFHPRFNAVLIETEEQLLHTSRYIHLNPHTSRIITKNEIKNYPYSSLNEYLEKPKIIDSQHLSNHFSSKEKHLQFTLDNADYQKTLHKIKHLTCE